MKIKKGIDNEIDLIKALNKKYYHSLSPNLKALMKTAYPLYRGLRLIKCQQCEKGRKPDAVIEFKKEKKYLSIKTGSSNIVHEEWVTTFILYLRENGISEETIKTILLFHYGDGTINGTGKIRYDYANLIVSLKDKISSANEELNSRKDFVIKTFIRFCIKGRNDNDISADLIYHGNIEYGVCVTKEQIISYLKRKSFTGLNSLHIGPFLIFPRARYLNFDEMYPERRHKIQIKWPNMANDLGYIKSRF